MQDSEGSDIVLVKTFPLPRSRQLIYTPDVSHEHVYHDIHPSRGDPAVAQAKAHRDAWELSDYCRTWRPNISWPTVCTKTHRLTFEPYAKRGFLHMDHPEPPKYVLLSAKERQRLADAPRMSHVERANSFQVGVNLARPFHIAAASIPTIQMVWLMDTGCGYDLIDEPRVRKFSRFCQSPEESISLATANGDSGVLENELKLRLPQL